MKKTIKSHPILWVLAGFLVTWILFFVFPVFLNGEQDMVFPRYIPTLENIGADLEAQLEFGRSRLIDKEYIGNYPPGPLLIFFPLNKIDFFNAYKLITAASIVSLIFVTLIIPSVLTKNKNNIPIIALIFFASLFSYGFQFELERGQFNIISLALCFLAIYIFHHKKKYRLLSYILFSISIQLKIWPGIFILLLIDDWGDIKNNLKRIVILLAANFLALFVLGYETFMGFVTATIAPNQQVWIGNHSIGSFSGMTIKLFGTDETKIIFIKISLFVLVGLCFLLIIAKLFKGKTKGLNEYLFLACTVGACVIPTISHDYKLAILPAGVAIFLNSIIPNKTEERKFSLIGLVFVLSVSFSMTMFSYVYKPLDVKSNLPNLIVILILTTYLFLSKRGEKNP